MDQLIYLSCCNFCNEKSHLGGCPSALREVEAVVHEYLRLETLVPVLRTEFWFATTAAMEHSEIDSSGSTSQKVVWCRD